LSWVTTDPPYSDYRWLRSLEAEWLRKDEYAYKSM
jgi:hypothetical protein